MIKNILTSVLISVIAILGFANYYPLFGNDNLGATLTTLNSSDNLVDFPTTYNANNTAINTDLTALEATTTMSLLTSAPNLATIGTITTGTWTSTDVGVAYGGTGASTFTEHAVLLGSSTNPIAEVSGLGSSGQFLTSGGAGTPPTWTTSAINQANDYTWTGYHIFGSAKFTIASTTDFTVDNDLTVSGGIGTTTVGVIESAGDVYIGGNLYVTGTTTSGVAPLHTTGTCNLTGGAGTTCTATANCPAGYVLTGGGALGAGADLQSSYPLDVDSWRATFQDEDSGDAGTQTTYVVCIGN